MKASAGQEAEKPVQYSSRSQSPDLGRQTLPVAFSCERNTDGQMGNSVQMALSDGVSPRGSAARPGVISYGLGSGGSTPRLHTGRPQPVCRSWRCNRGSCIPGGQRRSLGICERVKTSGRAGSCSNLRRAAVTLLPGLHEGVSTHRASVDAAGGGRVEQTGGVDLL